MRSWAFQGNISSYGVVVVAAGIPPPPAIPAWLRGYKCSSRQRSFSGLAAAVRARKGAAQLAARGALGEGVAFDFCFSAPTSEAKVWKCSVDVVGPRKGQKRGNHWTLISL